MSDSSASGGTPGHTGGDPYGSATPGAGQFGATPNPYGATPNPYGATPSQFGATPSQFGATPSQFGATPSPYAATPGATYPPSGFTTGGYALTPPPAKKSALPKVLAVVGILALVVVAFVGWGIYQRNRPIELPSTLAGLSMNTSPDVQQAVQSMTEGLSKENPGIATTAAVYGKAPKVVIVGAGRGQENVDADLQANAPGTVSNVGASKCSTVNGGAMCIRSEPGLTVVVLEVGGTPATAAGLVDLLWNQI
jgi:hypothetical protein